VGLAFVPPALHLPCTHQNALVPDPVHVVVFIITARLIITTTYASSALILSDVPTKEPRFPTLEILGASPA